MKFKPQFPVMIVIVAILILNYPYAHADDVEDLLIATNTENNHFYRDLQRALAGVGFDPGPVDGIWGSSSKSALASWRREYPDDLTEAVIAKVDQLISDYKSSRKGVVKATGPMLRPRGSGSCILYKSYSSGRQIPVYNNECSKCGFYSFNKRGWICATKEESNQIDGPMYCNDGLASDMTMTIVKC